MLSLKQFLLISLGHLMPVELAVGMLAYLNTEYALPIQYMNFAYFFAVGLHGIHWISKKYGNDIWEIIVFYRQNKYKINKLMDCVKVK